MLRHLSRRATELIKLNNNGLPIIGSRKSSSGHVSECEGITLEARNQVLWVKMDRPKKYNAITRDMYLQLTKTFRQVNEDKSIKALVLTGSGEYYSSGNDLNNLIMAAQDEGGPKAGLAKSRDLLADFVDSFIDLEKLLIAAVNGPAVGIPVTTLPLCDFVIASDKATFQAPFTALGQCPEACSSVTLPSIMGPSRASEILLLNMVWDAKKAHKYGLVSEVIPHEEFHEFLEDMLYGKRGIVEHCYPNSMKVSKSLVRNSVTKKALKETNQRECDAILKCWLGEETREALQKFSRRSKK